MDNTALRVEILRFYQANTNSKGHADFCPCAHLAAKLCISEIDLDDEVDYLKRKGYLSGSYVYGMKPAEGEYRITEQGLYFLEKRYSLKEDRSTFRRII